MGRDAPAVRGQRRPGEARRLRGHVARPDGSARRQQRQFRSRVHRGPGRALHGAWTRSRGRHDRHRQRRTGHARRDTGTRPRRGSRDDRATAPLWRRDARRAWRGAVRGRAHDQGRERARGRGSRHEAAGRDSPAAAQGRAHPPVLQPGRRRHAHDAHCLPQPVGRCTPRHRDPLSLPSERAGLAPDGVRHSALAADRVSRHAEVRAVRQPHEPWRTRLRAHWTHPS